MSEKFCDDRVIGDTHKLVFHNDLAPVRNIPQVLLEVNDVIQYATHIPVIGKDDFEG